MDIELSSNFLRKAKKLEKKEKKLLSDKVEIFKKDPNHPSLKTHPLTGRLKGMFSFSLTYSMRVVFIYIERDKALLIDVGTHEEVYK